MEFIKRLIYDIKMGVLNVSSLNKKNWLINNKKYQTNEGR